MGKASNVAQNRNAEVERELRREKAKHLIRVQMAVLAHWEERLSCVESAERLGVSLVTVERLRRLLQLTRGQAWRGGEDVLGRAREWTITVEVANG